MSFLTVISFLIANADDVYKYSMIFCAVSLAMLAFCFCAQQLPGRATKQYRTARNLVGIVCLIYSLLCFYYLFAHTRSINPYHATSISTSVYYLSGLVYELAFMPLMRPGFRLKKASVRNLLVWSAFVATQMAGHWLLPQYDQWVTWFGSLWFVIDALRITTLIFGTYHVTIRNVENVTSGYIRPRVQWIFNAAFAMIAWGLFCCIMPNLGRVAVALFSDIGVFVYLYMYLSINRYMIEVEQTEPVLAEVEQMVNEDRHLLPTMQSLFVRTFLRNDDRRKSEVQPVSAEEQPAETEITTDKLATALTEWIDGKNYLSDDISLNALAAQLGTNRSYLSQYINRQYNCSFRGFLNHLRVTEACAFLSVHPSADLSEVAAYCGYSTPSYFASVFKQEKGISVSGYAEQFAPGVA